MRRCKKVRVDLASHIAVEFPREPVDAIDIGISIDELCVVREPWPFVDLPSNIVGPSACHSEPSPLSAACTCAHVHDAVRWLDLHGELELIMEP